MRAEVSAAPGDLDALVQRVRDLAATRARVLVGIVGEPGAGKSTLAAELASALSASAQPDSGLLSAVAPMDGFHLAQSELERLGRADRKGAIDTFDGGGYVALLRRLRAQVSGDAAIYAPLYVRGAVEESIGSAIAISGDVRVILTEGNYLLAPTPPWSEVAELVDETWFLACDPAARRERLLARHLANGKPRERALAFTDGSDARNAELIAATAERAAVVVRWNETGRKPPSDLHRGTAER